MATVDVDLQERKGRDVPAAVPFIADLTISKAYALPGVAGAAEEGRWVVEGFASTTDLDSQDHMITPQALKQGADCLTKYNTLLFNHDPNRPIGYVEKAEAAEKQLLVKAVISKSEPKIWDQVKDGTLSKFSIFGRIRESEPTMIEGVEVLTIKGLDLYEVSLVSVPANPEAKSIAWYIEKALAVQGGAPPMVPQAWMQQIIASAIQHLTERPQALPGERKGEVTMQKSAHVDAAVAALRLEIAACEDPTIKQQLEAQVRALESLQSATTITDVAVTETVTAETTEDAEDAAALAAARMKKKPPPPMKSIDAALGVSAALAAVTQLSAALEGDEKDMAEHVVEWLSALQGELGVSEEAPIAKALLQSILPIMEELRTLTKQAGEYAKETREAHGAMEKLITALPLRKGRLAPVEERDPRQRETDAAGDPLQEMRTALGEQRYNATAPAEKMRYYLTKKFVDQAA